MDERESQPMISRESLAYELRGRLNELADATGKVHLSVRWEPRPQIVRVGACLENYTLDSRNAVLDRLLAFEHDHADEFGLEFDIIPLEGVQDDEFAEV
jgi:hypothetical protein